MVQSHVSVCITIPFGFFNHDWKDHAWLVAEFLYYLLYYVRLLADSFNEPSSNSTIPNRVAKGDV